MSPLSVASLCKIHKAVFVRPGRVSEKVGVNKKGVNKK
jgi:hypothetical protein